MKYMLASYKKMCYPLWPLSHITKSDGVSYSLAKLRPVVGRFHYVCMSLLVDKNGERCSGKTKQSHFEKNVDQIARQLA